jgi:hypothetical protein
MKRLLASLALLVSACGPSDEPAPAPPPPSGRAETQSIRNTDAVGTGGAAIADKVDAAIDTTEEADRKLKEEAERQSAGE